MAHEERYTMDRDSCRRGGGNHWKRHQNTTLCDASMGISSFRSENNNNNDNIRNAAPTTNHQEPLVSSTTAELLSAPTTNSLSLEVWLSAQPPHHDNSIVTSALTLPSRQTTDGLSVCDRHGVDFQLLWHVRRWVVIVRTASEVVEPCRVLSIPISTNYRGDRPMQHVLVSLQDGLQQVFLDGDLSATSHESWNLDRWTTQSWTLFGSSGPSSSLTVYQVGLFDRAFHRADELVARGLPPVAVPRAVSGEAIVAEEEAVSIRLVYESINTVVADYQQRHWTTMMKNVSLPLPRVYFYIHQLPLHGRLYQYDGTPVEAHSKEPALIAVDSPDGDLWFRPLPGEQHNVSTAVIGFCVSLVNTSRTEDCSESASFTVRYPNTTNATTGTTTNHVTNTTTARFVFDRDTCLGRGPFRGVIDQPLSLRRRDDASTVCDASLGIRANVSSAGDDAMILYSNDIPTFFTDNHHTAVSVELWLADDDAQVDELRPILTIESTTTDADRSGLSWCDEHGLDLQILQEADNALIVVFRTADEYIEPCQVTRIPMPSRNSHMMHVFVSLADGQQRIYIDGSLQETTQQSFDVHRWTAARLRLFTAAFFSSRWAGTLYQLTLSTSASLQHDNVSDLIRQGIAALSFPVAMNANCTIWEDSEVIAGSHENAWYETEAPLNDTSPIYLSYTSVDLQVVRFQERLGLEAKDLPSVSYYLVTLPTTGRLFQADGGAAIQYWNNDSGVLIPVDSSEGELVYIPPLDQHSGNDIMTSFQFCVAMEDTFLLHVAQCNVVATASIRVTSVNDPPIAVRQNETFVVPEGSLQSIQLQGTDRDVGDSIRALEITRFPRHGSVHLAVHWFRDDGLYNGYLLTNASSPNATIAVENGSSLWVDYFWAGQQKPPTLRGSHGMSDSFAFRVQDQGGLWSTEEVVSIRLVSSLDVAAPRKSTIHQAPPNESSSKIDIRAIDQSSAKLQRQLGVFIEVPPAQGRLVGDDGVPLLAGSRFFSVTGEFGLFFEPGPEMCWGTMEATDSFQFRIVAAPLNKSSQIVSTSDSHTHTIRVVCQLERLELTAPTGILSVQETNLRQITSNWKCDPTASDCHRMVVPNMTLRTKNSNHGYQRNWVRVKLVASNGWMSLDEPTHQRSPLQLIRGRLELTRGPIEFQAYPEDLTTILKGLTYQSHVSGPAHINLTVAVGDGNCSDALPLSRTCQLLHEIIHVQVVRDPLKYKARQRVSNDFPWPVFVCMIVYPGCYYLWITWKERAARLYQQNRRSVPKWIQHQDHARGMFYYENTEDGTTTWEAPVGEDFVPWEE